MGEVGDRVVRVWGCGLIGQGQRGWAGWTACVTSWACWPRWPGGLLFVCFFCLLVSSFSFIYFCLLFKLKFESEFD